MPGSLQSATKPKTRPGLFDVPQAPSVPNVGGPPRYETARAAHGSERKGLDSQVELASCQPS